MAETTLNFAFIMNSIKMAGETYLKENQSKNKSAKVLPAEHNMTMLEALVKVILEKQETDKTEIISELNKKLKTIEEQLEQVKAENTELRFDLDCAQQYNRRPNI